MAEPAKARTTESWQLSNWTDGLDASAHNAHSAIAFDWVPSGDSRPWSAQVQLHDMRIGGFVVGVNISPSPGNMQGDTYTVRNVKVDNVAFAFSVGQDQCRAVTFEDCKVNTAFCAFTNVRFGRGNGSAFNVTGGQYTGIFKMFEVTTAYRGQMAVTGVFAEGIGLMGTLRGLGINANAVVFNGCEFGFDNNGDGFTTPWTWLECGSNVRFVGCNIKASRQVLGVYMAGEGKLGFSGCGFENNFVIAAGGWLQERRISFHQTTHLGGWRPDDLVRDSLRGARATALWLQRYQSDGIGFRVTTEPVSLYVQDYLPTWGRLGELQKPDAGAAEITITERGHKARVGDLGAVMLGKRLTVDGMTTDAGGQVVPGVVVTAVQGDRITLRRLSPEVDLSQWCRYGGTYQVHRWQESK